MDIVGGPLTDFLNKLTEAGRLAQKYSVLGGSGKVGRMINNLSGAREGNRQSIYQQQQEQFWRYINPREQQIRDIRAWQRGERGEALQKRVSAITEKYGSLDATKIQAEVDAARKMLAEYIQGAKAILEGNPAPSPTSTTTNTPTGGTSGGNTFDASKIAFTGGEGFKAEKPAFEPMMNTIDFMPGLRKLMGMDGEQTRDWGKELGKVMSNYIDDPDKNKRNKQDKDDDRRQEAIYGNISRIAGSVQGMFSTLEQMGIEIPDELKSMVSGVQSIMEFMSAMTALVSTIAGTSTIKALPIIGTFAHNGAVIHAAGGAVTGNTYSGDQIPAMLNAGEVVLNRSQVGSLASALSGERGGGQNAQPFVTGDIIFLGLQNYLQENGYGKLMTTNMR